MSPGNIFLLVFATAVFVAAASAAKTWTVSATGWAWLALTLALYTLGNLVMLRLIREVGMGVALSLSAIVQLVAVNIVALAIFGERLVPLQAVGIVLGVVSMALIMLPR